MFTSDYLICCRCFERFFRGVNIKEGKLVAKRRAYMIEDLDLYGVDYVWQVGGVENFQWFAVSIFKKAVLLIGFPWSFS